MRLMLIVILYLCSFASFAQTCYPFSEPRKAQIFNQLLQQNRCLVCQNQALAGSTTAFAETLKQVIYQKIQAGESGEAVQAWLIARYGQFISYRPPWQRNTVLLWTLPLIMLIIGTIKFFQTLRLRTSNNNNG